MQYLLTGARINFRPFKGRFVAISQIQSIWFNRHHWGHVTVILLRFPAKKWWTTVIFPLFWSFYACVRFGQYEPCPCNFAPAAVASLQTFVVVFVILLRFPAKNWWVTGAIYIIYFRCFWSFYACVRFGGYKPYSCNLAPAAVAGLQTFVVVC